MRKAKARSLHILTKLEIGRILTPPLLLLKVAPLQPTQSAEWRFRKLRHGGLRLVFHNDETDEYLGTFQLEAQTWSSSNGEEDVRIKYRV